MKHTVTFWSALLVTSVAANKNLAYFFSGTEEECKRDEWDTDDLWNKSSTARNMDGLHFMGGGCVDDQPTGEENKRKWIWLPNIQTVNNRNVYCLVAQEKTGCHDKDDGTCATMQLSVSRMFYPICYFHAGLADMSHRNVRRLLPPTGFN